MSPERVRLDVAAESLSKRRLVQGAVVLSSAAAIATSVVLNAGWARDDAEQKDERDAATQALASAKENIPRILSYDFSALDGYRGRIDRLTTGEFGDELRTLLDERIVKVAKREGIVTRATVPDIAVVEVKDSETVVLLAFVNQVTRKRDTATPVIEGSRIVVEVVKDDDEWKVSDLDPV